MKETNSKGTIQKWMLKRFAGSGTKAGQRNVVSKRRQMLGRVENSVSHLPRKIDKGGGQGQKKKS